METLKVTLKQHTPLIHFQHDQYGATLRASEVKPKLDKYIVQKAFKNKFEDCRSYLVGYDPDRPDALKEKFAQGYRALNYKMRIEAKKEEEYLVASSLGRNAKESLEKHKILFIDQSPYFAQEKENKSVVRDRCNWDKIRCKGIMYSDITVTVYSLVKGALLESYVYEKIQSFFLSENFGNRQDKGFGCFEATEISLNGEILLLGSKEKLLKEIFSFVYKKRLNDISLKNIFKTISEDYKLLKSGKYKPYAKSKIMLYGLSNGQRWEKKFFKENVDGLYATKTNGQYYHLLSSHNVNNTELNDDEEYFYLRALLGLANQYEFLLNNPPAPGDKLVVTVNGVDGVERYKSPIMFKVMGDSIYLVGNSISKEILDREFVFDVTIQGDDGWKHDKIEETLFTPASFDLGKFLEESIKDKSNNAILSYSKIK